MCRIISSRSWEIGRNVDKHPISSMLKKVNKSSYFRPLLGIHTKVERVLHWPTPHPSTKLRGNLLSCFCVILFKTDQQTYRGENTSSLAAVTEDKVLSDISLCVEESSFHLQLSCCRSDATVSERGTQAKRARVKLQYCFSSSLCLSMLRGPQSHISFSNP